MKTVVKGILAITGGVFLYLIYRMVKGVDKVVGTKLNEWDAVLVGGRDDRAGDYKLEEQLRIFKRGFGTNKRVKAYRYADKIEEILNFLKEHPNTPIFLFSAGCSKAYDLATDKNVDPKLLFIIEPYAISSAVRKVVRDSVLEGVPKNNVYFGNGQGRGEGVISGATYTEGNSHWNALTFVGSKKSYL
jgi:hypothetical protein